MRKCLEAYRDYTIAMRRTFNISDYREKIARQRELMSERARLPEIEEMTRQLDQLLTEGERDVLQEYYICAIPTWEQVAETLHYSISRVYQLRQSAMEKIERVQIC